MKSDNKLSLIILHFILDSTGLTLLALGVAKLQVNVDLLPESLRFPYQGWLFLLLGFALFLPTIMVIYRYFKNTNY